MNIECRHFQKRMAELGGTWCKTFVNVVITGPGNGLAPNIWNYDDFNDTQRRDFNGKITNVTNFL